MSATVIGSQNELLSSGATALSEGRTDLGIQLTLEGLKLPSSAHDLAAGHANACAGYVVVRLYAEALTHCNTAIDLDPANWRAYNNRAAVYSALGLYEQALADVEAGLKLSPSSATLHKSLSIIRENQNVTRRRNRRRAA